MPIAVVLVADHGIGGVGGFVGEAAGQPGDGEPEQRRDDAIGKILGKAFDRRARDAGLVERGGIASDDLRYRAPPGFEPVAFERLGDAAHMIE